MLVDTGSAVTIHVLREDVWNEISDSYGAGLLKSENDVIAANGEKLQVTGKCKLPFRIGNIDVSHPVLITKGVTQECLLGADFLNKHFKRS